MNRAGIVLAAGEGTRMKSTTPKVMHTVAGLPILGHVINAMKGAGIGRIVVVTAKDASDVRAFAEAQDTETVVQDEQLGTGHAANCARDALEDFDGSLVVTYGDHPLFTAATFESSLAAREKPGLALVGFEPEDAAMYGRVVCDADGFVVRMVEFRDANEKERKLRLCSAGVISADAKAFFRWSSRLTNDNKAHEYYLTEVPMLARKDGQKTAVVIAPASEVLGVNDRSELAEAEREMQARLRAGALLAGAGLVAPETVFLSFDTLIEPDAVIEPYCVFGTRVTVRSGARIRAYTHLEGAEVQKGAIVGPYARLRPGARIEEDVHIGNFVEVKNALIEKGAKANHLAYLGDARVGPGANIGAGAITCNYDGFDKYVTDIGAGVFVGSNAALVAPIKLADGTYVGAGSVITKPTNKDSLAVTRAEQKEIAGWAAKFRARKRSGKAKSK